MGEEKTDSVHVFKLVVGVCVKKLGCFQVLVASPAF